MLASSEVLFSTATGTRSAVTEVEVWERWGQLPGLLEVPAWSCFHDLMLLPSVFTISCYSGPDRVPGRRDPTARAPPAACTRSRPPSKKQPRPWDFSLGKGKRLLSTPHKIRRAIDHEPEFPHQTKLPTLGTSAAPGGSHHLYPFSSLILRRDDRRSATVGLELHFPTGFSQHRESSGETGVGRLRAAATSPFPRSAAACVEVMAASVCRALTEKARASGVGKLWKRENEIFLHMPSPCMSPPEVKWQR